MANTPSKTDYKFYLGEHGMDKQLTDEFFKSWKGSRGLKAFKQHKNLPTSFQKTMNRSLLKKLIPNRRSNVSDMYKD